MQHYLNRATALAAAIAAGLGLPGLSPSIVHAETLTWDTDKTPPASVGGTGAWNIDPTNNVWFRPSDSTAVPWVNAGQDGVTPDDAVFGFVGGTVTVGVPITTRSITLSPTSGTYTLNGTAANPITLAGTGVGSQLISVTAAAATTNVGASITAGTLTVNNGSGQTLNFNAGNLTFTGIRRTGGNTIQLTQGASSVYNLSGDVELGGTGLLELRYNQSGASGSVYANASFNRLIADAGGTALAPNQANFNFTRQSASNFNELVFSGGLLLKSSILIDPNNGHVDIGDITLDANGQTGPYVRRFKWWDGTNNGSTANGVDWTFRVNGDANSIFELDAPGPLNLNVDNSATMLGTIRVVNGQTNNHTMGLNANGAYGAIGQIAPSANNSITLDLNVTPNNKDRLDLLAGAFLLGSNTQLDALTRVATAGTAGPGANGSIRLAPDSYVIHETDSPTTIGDISLGGTVADVYFAFSANRTQNQTVGAGSGWKGISTDRAGSRTWSTGTITANGNFELRGTNGQTLILGNGTNASTLKITGTPSVVTISNGTVRLNAGGASPTADYSAVTQWTVANNATLAFGQLNALGGAGAQVGTAPVVVQSGGGLQWDNVPTTFTGTGVTLEASYVLKPNVPVLHPNALLYPASGNTVTLGGSNVLVLQGGAATGTGAATGGTTITAGALGVSNLDQIGGGNLNLNGGVIVLDNISWAQLLAARPFGTGAGQMQLNSGGFAARGAAVVIPAGNGVTASTFDRNFQLGHHGVVGGSIYANAPVELAASTTLTARRIITIGTAGPGLSNGPGVANVISGNLSGAGAPIFRSSSNGSDASSGEVVLSGTNSWTGAPTEDFDGGGTTVWVSAGKGGLIVSTGATNPGSNGDVFVRFANQASLPNGNAGANAYLMANRYATGTNTDGRSGYLLTGNNTPGGSTYRLNNGYKFVLGGRYNTGTAGALGSTGGLATLEDSTVAFIRDTNANGNGILFVRDGTFRLGTHPGDTGAVTPGAVLIQPAIVNDNGGTDPGINSTASVLADVTTTRTLIKRGAGTLDVNRVNYTKVDGATDASSQILWLVADGALRYNDDTPGRQLGGVTVTPAAGVTSPAVLGGDGVIGLAATKTLTITGTSASARGVVSPGNSIGTLTATGSAVFGNNSSLEIELGPTGVSDSLALTGTGTNGVMNMASAGNTDRLELLMGPGFTGDGTYTVATFASSTGTFDSVLFQGTAYTAANDGDGLTVNYNATSITIEATGLPVPEPTGLAMIAVAGLGLLRRRRR